MCLFFPTGVSWLHDCTRAQQLWHLPSLPPLSHAGAMLNKKLFKVARVYYDSALCENQVQHVILLGFLCALLCFALRFPLHLYSFFRMALCFARTSGGILLCPPRNSNSSYRDSDSVVIGGERKEGVRGGGGQSVVSCYWQMRLTHTVTELAPGNYLYSPITPGTHTNNF
jgi:hypothetical protein